MSIMMAQAALGIFQAFQSQQQAQAAADLQANTILAGSSLSASGALLTAQGFRTSAKTIKDSTDFNLKIQSDNTLRQLSALSTQFQRSIGAQLSAQSVSGLSVTSKSFLAVQNETASSFEKALRNVKIDAENNRRKTIYESEIRQINLENQARAAEFQSQANQALAEAKAASVRSSTKGSAFSNISSVARVLPSILGGA